MNLRIDPEFRDCLDPLDEKSRQTLEESIREDGCRDALVVWPQPDGDPILLDGHNRHEICERYGIAFRTVNCPDSVIDRAKAAGWIIKNQQGRRNMTADRLAYLCGRVFEAEKREPGGTGANRFTVQLCQNGTAVKKTTAEKVAEAFGISPRTVHRNVHFANAVDAIAAKHGPEAKAEILAGRKKVSDFMPKPEPESPIEEEAPLAPASEPKPPLAPSAGELPAADPAQEDKPKSPDFLNQSHTQCITWMARNLTPNGPSGAVLKPIPMPESASENLADPEVLARGDNPFIFILCQMEYHATRAELELKLHPPPVAMRPSLKKRLADLSSALETLSLALEEQK